MKKAGSGDRPGADAGAQARESVLRWIITVFAAIVLLLHLAAAFNPSALNWGFHQSGFFPDFFKFAVPALMVFFLIPPVQRWIVSCLELLSERFERQQGTVRKALLAGFIVVGAALFWVFRERLFILGDGYLIARMIPVIRPEEVATLFRNETLAFFVSWKLWQFLQWLGFHSTGEFAIQLVSILCGGGSIVILARLTRMLAESRVEQLLLFLFVIACGSTQLFFGYVENYAILYFIFLLFVYAGVAFLRSRIHLVVPCVVYGILLTIHVGMTAMFPAVVLLSVIGWRRHRWYGVAASIAAMLTTAAVILWMCGSSLSITAETLTGGSSHLIPLTETADRRQVYTLLSGFHFLDVVNLFLLLAPFAPIAFAAIIILEWKIVSTNRHLSLFLSILGLCGFAFIFFVNPEIGTSRDWDLLSTYAVGLIVASGSFWLWSFRSGRFRFETMVMMIGITATQTAVWIGLNATETPALERFATLSDRRLWSTHAVLSADEELAIYYRGREDASRALEYYRKYVAIDSSNARIWASIAHLYELSGDKENEMRAYERAVGAGTTFWDVYVNLGVIYGSRDRPDDAVRMLRRGYELNPESPMANTFLGMFLLRQGASPSAVLPYFLTAIRNDPRFPPAYYCAGRCSQMMNDRQGMATYWKKYLELDPTGPAAAEVRAALGSVR